MVDKLVQNSLALKLRVIVRKYWIVLTALEMVTAFCLLVGGVFDIDRGTSMIQIMSKTVEQDNPVLVCFGLFWVICFIIEVCLALTRNSNKYIIAWRLFVCFFVPSHIIYNVIYLHIELFSADSLLFVIIPICQWAIITCDYVTEEAMEYDSYLSYDRKSDYE